MIEHRGSLLYKWFETFLNCVNIFGKCAVDDTLASEEGPRRAHEPVTPDLVGGIEDDERWTPEELLTEGRRVLSGPN